MDQDDDSTRSFDGDEEGDFDDDSQEEALMSLEDESLNEYPVVTDSSLNLSSVMVINRCYRSKLLEFRSLIVQRLEENQEKQSKILNNTQVEEDCNVNETTPRPSTTITPFLAPYFKDAKGFSAPDNQDTQFRRWKGILNQAWISSSKHWTPSEKKRLSDSVRMQFICRQTDPLLLKKEAAKKKSTEETKKELESIDDKIQEIIDQSLVSVPSRQESQELDWMRISVQSNVSFSDVNCRLKWMNEEHPEVDTSEFSEEEKEKMKELVIKHGFDWSLISKELSKSNHLRLPWFVASFFQQNLNPDMKRTGPLSASEILLLKTVMKATEENDCIPWTRVQYFMKGRSTAQLKHFWDKSKCLKNGVPWTEFEDQVLTVAVARFGVSNWIKVSQAVYPRSNRQCRERYMLRLGIKDRKSGSWTREEDGQIIRLAKHYNFEWTRIQKEMQGRNGRQIASRYQVIQETVDQNKIRTLKSNMVMKTEADIRQEIPQVFESKENMDKFLKEAREKLMEMAMKQKRKRRRKKESLSRKESSPEQQIERQLIEIFAFYSDNFDEKSEHKAIDRSFSDEQLFVSVTEALKDILQGKGIPSTHPLAEVLKCIFNEDITGNTEEGHPILPPNRITLRGLQTLLLHRDYLAKKLSDEGMSDTSLVKGPEYLKLLKQLSSLFLWPSVCSLLQPPVYPPSEPISFSAERTGSQRDLLQNLHCIRDAQIRLFSSVNQNNELNGLFTRIKGMNGEEDVSPEVIQEVKSVLFPEKKLKRPTSTVTSETSDQSTHPKKIRKRRTPSVDTKEPVEPTRRSCRTRTTKKVD